MNRIAYTICALALLTSCGTQSGANPNSGMATPAGNVLFQEISQLRGMDIGSSIFVPGSLRESLPNQRFAYPGGSAVDGLGGKPWTFSEAVLVGKVVDVSVVDRLPGHIDDNEGLDAEHGSESVPAGAPNWALVTLQVDDAVGSPTGSVQRFKLGLGGFSDPRGVAAGLENLGTILIVVDRDETGLFYPVEGGALIGQVGGNGDVSFPGLGNEEATFVVGLDTVDEILQEARVAVSEPIVLGS